MTHKTRSDEDFIIPMISAALDAGFRMLPEPDGKELLRRAGLATPSGVIGRGAEEVIAASSRLDPPFVLKVVSPTVVHKSDLGGVALGIHPDELESAVTAMGARVRDSGHDVSHYLLEEQASPGQEMVIGAVRDETGRFVVMIGLGGVFVEVLQDVAFRLSPVSRGDITEMLGELRGHELLLGRRGHAPVDVDQFIEVVHSIAGDGGLLFTLPPEISEVDLNPVVVWEQGAMVLDARFVLGDAPHGDQTRGEWTREGVGFASLFTPQSVAVVGASARTTNPANLFIRNLSQFGFTGKIHPVHPTATDIEGLPAVASLGDLDTIVDYAFVSLPASLVPAALTSGAHKVRFAQVISSGFGEIPNGEALELETVAAARQGNIRLIGPNCLGIHSPRGDMTFIENAPRQHGSVAVISQSGGLSVDFLRLGEQRGIAFSSVVSIGNGADVSAAELLSHFLHDPETEVIGLYLESLVHAAEVVDVLRENGGSKPVMLLAGGRTDGGARAAMSHTGSLSSNHRLWPALARQGRMILVDSLSELLDCLLAFQLSDKASPRPNSDVVLFGNGGGTSVLATDALERAGLTVPRLPENTTTALSALDLPPGTSLANPLDAPAWTLAVQGGHVAYSILSAVLRTSDPAVVISHFNVGIIVSNTRGHESDVMAGLINGVAQARDESPGAHHLLVLRSDGKRETADLIDLYRGQATRAGIPVFAELLDASLVARSLLTRDRDRSARESS